MTTEKQDRRSIKAQNLLKKAQIEKKLMTALPILW